MYPRPKEDEVKLYTLLKKNCKKLDKESMILNSGQFDNEMLKIRKFLNENNISFPLNINKIEIVKKELSEFILKNNMDIILIFMDYSYLNLIFLSENDNNSIINGIESIIFKKSNKIFLDVKY
tara:strand:- start:113 stop:481 length:369 start_codon:yes stop_codon:yes gene_type:complete